MFIFQYQNGKKPKSGKKFSGLQNGAIRGLQTETGFRDLQIGARGIINRGRFRDFKSEQKDYKSGERNFKSGQRLQIGVIGISNRGRDYKSVQNTWNRELKCHSAPLSHLLDIGRINPFIAFLLKMLNGIYSEFQIECPFIART